MPLELEEIVSVMDFQSDQISITGHQKLSVYGWTHQVMNSGVSSSNSLYDGNGTSGTDPMATSKLYRVAALTPTSPKA